jgi:Transposase DDE domain group 1
MILEAVPARRQDSRTYIRPSTRTSRHYAEALGDRREQHLSEESPSHRARLTGDHRPEDGWRYSLWVTNLPTRLRGWQANPGYIDAAHRVHARVEDCVRTGKDTGIGKLPSHLFALNAAWLAAALIATNLLAWLQLLALDRLLSKAEPKTLRYRLLHAAGRLARGGWWRCLKIAATWPWAPAIVTAWNRIAALPQAPDQQETVPATKERS